MKQIRFNPFVIILLVLVSNCKKSIDTDLLTASTQVIVNPALANANDTLQAVLTRSDHAMEAYYYGSFSANGYPDKIKHATILKKAVDSAVYVNFDDSLRPRTVTTSFHGIKTNEMLTFDYSIPSKTTISYYYYNSNTDSVKLLSQFTVDKAGTGYQLTDHVTYSFIGGQFFTLLGITFGDTPPDELSQFLASVGVANASLVVTSVQTFAGVTALGCILGSAVPAVGTTVGCVVGGILGMIAAIPNATAGETTGTAPPGVPVSSSAVLSFKMLLGNPSRYPYLHSYSGGCYGTIECSFICSADYWDNNTNTPLVRTAGGTLQHINGVVFTGITSNWGSPSAFINANNSSGIPTLAYTNINKANGFVTGTVAIYGDVGTCNSGTVSQEYIVTFNAALVYTTLGPVSQSTNLSGTYTAGSNFVYGHQ